MARQHTFGMAVQILLTTFCIFCTAVLEYTGDKAKGIIVIIKPGKKSKYKNLVDILDEMAICNVPTYAIVNDITPEEQKLVDEMNK